MTERLPLTEFQPWPKIPRLNRNITVTEKIDGTNAAIVIRLELGTPRLDHEFDVWVEDEEGDIGALFAVAAQSRNKWITPGKTSDNAGFAAWVWDNAETLVRDLGVGRHFGEWWGQGIQRNYGLDHKVFSLFDVRWKGPFLTEHLSVVPTLAEWHGFDSTVIDNTVMLLTSLGSYAAPGFMKPEGIVVRHGVSGHTYKRLIEGDDVPKGTIAGARGLVEVPA